MTKIFEQANLLGVQKRLVLSNVLIAYCIQKDSSFGDWIQNKFLKYEFDLIDEDDLRVLDESVVRLVAEHLNQFIDEGNVGSIQELLSLVLQVRDSAKACADIGFAVDELTHQLSDGADVKFSTILKLLKVLGLTVQISI